MENAAPRGQTVIFVNKRKDGDELVDILTGKLSSKVGRIATIHSALAGKSNKAQPDYERRNVAMRCQVIRELKTRAVEVLLATDVFARGIDAPEITTVINLDMPVNNGTGELDTYCHRIGRCGRQGRPGIAISLVQESEEHQMLAAIKYKFQKELPSWVEKDETGAPVEAAVKEIKNVLDDGSEFGYNTLEMINGLWETFSAKIKGEQSPLPSPSLAESGDKLGPEFDRLTIAGPSVCNNFTAPDDEQKCTTCNFSWLEHIREYNPDEEVIDITTSEQVLTVDELAEKLDVAPGGIINAATSNSEEQDFDALGLPRHAVDAIFSSWPQITRPSEIQISAIPEILKGNHIIAQAPTGTGKSLAFVISILSNINRDSNHVQAICLSPTKDLAFQTLEDWFKPLIASGGFGDIRAHICVGGFEKPPMSPQGRINQHILVGTPDCIYNMMNARKKPFEPQHVKFICLDEADDLVRGEGASTKLGSTKQIIRSINPRGRESPCQILCFSATFPVSLTEHLKESIIPPSSVRK